jgi:hypothetical protein
MLPVASRLKSIDTFGGHIVHFWFIFAAKTFDGTIESDTNRQVKHQDVINFEKSKASIRYALRRLVSSIGQESINQKTMI